MIVPSDYDLLRRPVITEKATSIAPFGVVTFIIRMDATKGLVKRAVESIYDVKVKKVRTLIVKGKRKRTRRGVGVSSDKKKAYVTLHEGYDIDVGF